MRTQVASRPSNITHAVAGIITENTERYGRFRAAGLLQISGEASGRLRVISGTLSGMNLLFASQNRHKMRELSALLAPHTLTLPEDIGIEYEFEETGTSLIENAIGKALHSLLPHRKADRLRRYRDSSSEP